MGLDHALPRAVRHRECLNYVVDRFDLRRDIQLNTEVTGAVFNEQRNLWQVRTSTGDAFTSRYLITALGLLAKTNIPPIPGLESFGGALVHTNAWPPTSTSPASASA